MVTAEGRESMFAPATQQQEENMAADTAVPTADAGGLAVGSFSLGLLPFSFAGFGAPTSSYRSLRFRVQGFMNEKHACREPLKTGIVFRSTEHDIGGWWRFHASLVIISPRCVPHAKPRIRWKKQSSISSIHTISNDSRPDLPSQKAKAEQKRLAMARQVAKMWLKGLMHLGNTLGRRASSER